MSNTNYKFGYAKGRMSGRKSVIPVLKKMRVSIQEGYVVTPDDIDKIIKWIVNPQKKYEPDFKP